MPDVVKQSLTHVSRQVKQKTLKTDYLYSPMPITTSAIAVLNSIVQKPSIVNDKTL